MSKNGTGVPHDFTEALRLFWLADNRNADNRNNLALM